MPSSLVSNIILVAPGDIKPSDGTSTTQPAQASQFTKGVLSILDLAPSPLTQFHAWYSAAVSAHAVDPYTVCLSTASLPSGRVSARMLYLKELDNRGFVVYSNWGTSRKAADIESNTWVALTFYWRELEQQIRVEGKVERLSQEESQQYFDTRARASRIGAWASEQSKALRDGQREELEERVEEMEKKFQGVEKVPVPGFWGGVRIIPEMLEFWQGRDSRLHDRLKYEKQEDGTWKIERLSP
jgi:pyridoxamine 5'-phosphate oxidase